MCATQWRTSMVGRIGLDYNTILKMAEILNIIITPGLIHKIQILEYSVLQGSEQKNATN